MACWVRRTPRPTATWTRRGCATPSRRWPGRTGSRSHSERVVVAINTAKGQVSGVRTDRGDVECEVVVDCGGMFAAEIARLVGVRIPVVPMSHQYVVTTPLPAGSVPADRPLPSLRDPDLLVYYRQEVDGLVMGGYERQSAPWTATARSYDAVPSDFNGKLLPPDWDRFTEILENSQVRVPVLADTGITTMINGPEAFTPDNEFCLGRDRGRRLLRRRRVLCARHRRRRRDRAGDGRLDPRRRPGHGPVAHGRAPLRPPLPLARLHACAHRRELRELLRHPLPGGGACRGPAAAHLAGLRLARRARRGVRREGRVGSGSTTTPSQARRSCGRGAGRAGTGRRASSPSTARSASRQACSTRAPSRRSRSAARTRRRSARTSSPGGWTGPRAPWSTPRRSTTAAASRWTSPSPGSPTTSSSSSPAPRWARTTSAGFAARPG